MKKLFLFLLPIVFATGVFFSDFSPAFAASSSGLVPCGNTGQGACTLCHLLVGIHGIITWLRNLLLIAATVAIVISGFLYIFAAGNTGKMENAKKILFTSLQGFALVLSAWLIVNTILLLISAKEDLGVGKTNWYTFDCNTVSTTTKSQTTQGGETVTPPSPNECKPTNNGCGGLSAPNGGCEYTSAELAAKLACMKSKNVGAVVTSVTKNGVSDWCQKCAWTYSGSSYCAHSENSCHFGGKNCKGTSQAVDFNKSDAVAQAAKECGFDTVIWKATAYYRSGSGYASKGASDHTDHVHASVNNKTCGCDYLK